MKDKVMTTVPTKHEVVIDKTCTLQIIPRSWSYWLTDLQPFPQDKILQPLVRT
jgi:hypothetical protein